jgi:hypothetical protein
MSEVDRMTVIARDECPTCGRVRHHLDRDVCAGVLTIGEHKPVKWVAVEYVDAAAYRGAVDRIEALRRVQDYQDPDAGTARDIRNWNGALDAAILAVRGQ